MVHGFFHTMSRGIIAVLHVMHRRANGTANGTTKGISHSVHGLIHEAFAECGRPAGTHNHVTERGTEANRSQQKGERVATHACLRIRELILGFDHNRVNHFLGFFGRAFHSILCRIHRVWSFLAHSFFCVMDRAQDFVVASCFSSASAIASSLLLARAKSVSDWLVLDSSSRIS